MAELNEDKLAELRAVYNQPQGGMSEAVSKMDDIRKRIVTLKERRSVR